MFGGCPERLERLVHLRLFQRHGHACVFLCTHVLEFQLCKATQVVGFAVAAAGHEVRPSLGAPGGRSRLLQWAPAHWRPHVHHG